MPKNKQSEKQRQFNSLQKKMQELRDQQGQLQQQIFDLAYSMSLQLQLLEDLSRGLESLDESCPSTLAMRENRIVYLKEYLERIPH